MFDAGRRHPELLHRGRSPARRRAAVVAVPSWAPSSRSNISALRLSLALSISVRIVGERRRIDGGDVGAVGGCGRVRLGRADGDAAAVSSRVSSVAALSAGSSTRAPVPAGPAKPSLTVSAPIGPIAARSRRAPLVDDSRVRSKWPSTPTTPPGTDRTPAPTIRSASVGERRATRGRPVPGRSGRGRCVRASRAADHRSPTRER